MKINLRELITLDFETYYSQSFSLRSKELNTSEYIRSPEFKVHCCTIKIGEGKTKCYPASKLKAEFAKIDWSKYDLLAHNTCFDAAILLWHYGHKPRRYFDTLSMTRGLHAEMTRAGLDAIARYYGIGAKHATYLTPTKGLRDLTPALYATLAEGCVIDTDLCFEIFKKQIEVYPEDEIALIDMTVRMFVEPILHVDVARAERALEYEMNNRLRAIALSRVSEKTLNSSPQFAQALRDVDCEPPMKWSEKQGCMTTAFAMTDLNFLELLDHEDLRVIRLVEGRLAAKSTIIETRAYRLIKAGKDGMALPVMLNYFGAKTGRWSGGNKLNLQNLNRQEYNEDGTPVPMTGELRKSIIAPPKHVVMVCDSAQIEARTLAWFAGQDDLTAQFANNEDVYSVFASEIYGVKVTKKDKEMRFVGKISILGLGYMMGAPKYRTTLARGSMGPPVHIDAAFAKKVVTTYRKTNNMIAQCWKEADQVLTAMANGESGDWNCLSYEPGTIWLPNGMGLHYPDLRVLFNADTGRKNGFEYMANGHPKKIYGGLLVENCIAEGTLVLTDHGWKPIESVEPTDQVHDGDSFVPHGGLVFKSVQACITIDGVGMTPDHEVLTDDGWTRASQQPRPYRPLVAWKDRRPIESHSDSCTRKPVYDILNAGPQRRFVVLGDNGPFIVHNCIQALARVIVSSQMIETQNYFRTVKLRKGEIMRIASMSHDEIISVVPARIAEATMSKQVALMHVAPEWCSDIPLGAEGGFDVQYSK